VTPRATFPSKGVALSEPTPRATPRRLRWPVTPARSKPNWAVFSGGPLDGQRTLLAPGVCSGTHVERTPSATPGLVTPHEYGVTGEFRAVEDGPWTVRSRVLRYAGSRADEPPPAPPGDVVHLTAKVPPPPSSRDAA
jgi:hypothetical protein